VYMPKVNTPIKATILNILFFIILVILFLYDYSVSKIKKRNIKTKGRSVYSCFQEVISIIPNRYTGNYPIFSRNFSKFTVIYFPVHFFVFYNNKKKLLGNQKYWILFSSVKTDDIVIIKLFGL
jgi:hypothetical protein